jgi:hypothetical protein
MDGTVYPDGYIPLPVASYPSFCCAQKSGCTVWSTIVSELLVEHFILLLSLDRDCTGRDHSIVAINPVDDPSIFEGI